MSTEPTFLLPVSEWLQLHGKEIDRLHKALDDERKARAKREFVLVVTCLLALLYTYPVRNLAANPEIDIPSISLKIPLREALTVFPTLIAATYLVFFSSAIGQLFTMQSLHIYNRELDQVRETGVVPRRRSWRFPVQAGRTNVRYLLLPSPLHARLFNFHESGAAALSRFFVEVFVGSVFVLLPYATAVFVSVRGWELIRSKILHGWDSFCLLVMLGSLASGVLASLGSGR
jgi:hypothetical protein